jgi:hypothetical protein
MIVYTFCLIIFVNSCDISVFSKIIFNKKLNLLEATCSIVKVSYLTLFENIRIDFEDLPVTISIMP